MTNNIQIHRNLAALPAFRRAVITIGSFDGVHIGHQFILRRLVELAKQVGGESVVVTFSPHPRKVFGDAALRLINTLEEKAALLQTQGIQHLVVVPFSKEFAAQSPDAYIQDFLVQHFHPLWVVIGYDHRYGKARAGDVAYMRSFEQACGFCVEEISKQVIEDIAVSSTKVRNAVADANIALANQLLGHRFGLGGRVVDGDKIGNSLGFPTANIQVNDPDKLIPPQGIYAVQVHYQTAVYGGMLYIGNRPTLDNHSKTNIEVHIFQFNQRIYGEYLFVEFIDFLRADHKFNSLDELKAQLAKDREAAQAVLARTDF